MKVINDISKKSKNCILRDWSKFWWNCPYIYIYIYIYIYVGAHQGIELMVPRHDSQNNVEAHVQDQLITLETSELPAYILHHSIGLRYISWV